MISALKVIFGLPISNNSYLIVINFGKSKEALVVHFLGFTARKKVKL